MKTPDSREAPVSLSPKRNSRAGSYDSQVGRSLLSLSKSNVNAAACNRPLLVPFSAKFVTPERDGSYRLW